MTETVTAGQRPIPRLELDALRPFLSLTLARADEEEAGDRLFQQVLAGCAQVVRDDGPRKRRGLAAQPKQETYEAVQAGAMMVEEVSTPAWTTQPEIVDVRHHVLVVIRLGELFAFHSDDAWIRETIARNLGARGVPGLAKLSLVPQGIMNAAFVQGVTRTVWLRGIHHPTSLKSDTKMLSGTNLGDAIDPLGDQTYHFTAVRCELDDGDVQFTVGVAPDEGRIWVSRMRNWEVFRAAAVIMLTRVAETRNPSFAPIRFLAVPGPGGAEVSHAFDMGLYPPELMETGAGDPAVEDRVRIASEYAFLVDPGEGANLTATVLRHGERKGRISLHFLIEDEQVTCNAAAVADRGADRGDLEKIEQYCEDRATLVVRYDSDHVISGGTLFRYRFRDHPFPGYAWADLGGWTITREKPGTLADIGNDSSLFDWVWGRWSGLLEEGFGGGWLACDDGAGEKADFIHFDEARQELTLIHVKASDSDSPGRSVAVAKYEVVTSQAIKNLRYLDRDNLRDGLLARLGGGERVLTWRDGTPCGRDDFLRALARMQARCTRKVVIVQPHLQREVWARAEANPESQEGRRLRQLNTLLVGADGSCRAVGASLTVIGVA
ncbi:MAG TPA: hypothetical protein VJT67_13610 [Longimicrobiaceae bacterium]|nr:hypothetical protein [Longimicrobiaceae bacterium]